jgi:hypothetical protein
MSMRLKIKSETGQFIIPNGMITLETNLSTLLLVIESLSKIAQSSVKSLLIGYPPRKILPSIENLDLSLSCLQIKNGDVITISELKNLRSEKYLQEEEIKHNLISKKDRSYVDLTTRPENQRGRKRSSADREREDTEYYQSHSKTTPIIKESNRSSSNSPDLDFQSKRFSVPADNTCAFYSIYYLLHNGKLDKSLASEYRNLVSNKVLTNNTGLDNYLGELTLGRPIDEYCAWIQSDSSWGGAIELSILAKHFKVCISAIDVKSSRIDRYCTEYSSKTIYMLYDGIHYDPLYIEYEGINLKFFNFDRSNIQQSLQQKSLSNSNDQEKIDINKLTFVNKVEQEFSKLAEILRVARAYTDNQSRVLCGNCNIFFDNFDQAIEHGKKTGHINFQQT